MRLRSMRLVLLAAVTLACAATASRGQAAGPVPVDQASLAKATGAALAITKPGSYVLRGNVIVKRPNQDALDITASNVTLDLQGFAIIGTGTSGTGIGINVLSGVSNVTITSGTVTKMGGGGLVLGPNSVVSSVKAMQNLGVGIQAGASSQLTDNVAVGNAGNGLMCANDCLVTGNVSTGNGAGLSLGPGSGYGNNVLDDTTKVSGGVSLGNNICSGVQC